MATLAELIALQKAKQAEVKPIQENISNNLTPEQSKLGPATVPTGMISLSGFSIKTPTPAPTPKLEAKPDTLVGATGPAEPVVSIPVEPAKEFNHSAMTEKMSSQNEEAFKAAIEVLHNCISDIELARNATVNILRGLHENPNFVKFLVPEDCGLMVRNLRESYGLVASSKIAKNEKKAAKATTIENLANEIGEILNL